MCNCLSQSRRGISANVLSFSHVPPTVIWKRSHFPSLGPLQPFPEAVKALWQLKSCCGASVPPTPNPHPASCKGGREDGQKKTHPVSHGGSGSSVPCDSWSSPAGSLRTSWGWTEGTEAQRESAQHKNIQQFTKHANSIYIPHLTDRYLCDLDCLHFGNAINVGKEFFGLGLLFSLKSPSGKTPNPRERRGAKNTKADRKL